MSLSSFSQGSGGEGQRVGGIISLKGGWGILKLCFREPGIFLSRVSFPPEEVFVIGGRSAVFKDLLEFIFLFSVNNVRGWHWEISTVGFIFFIRGEEGSMEDWMDLPGMGEMEFI